MIKKQLLTAFGILMFVSMFAGTAEACGDHLEYTISDCCGSGYVPVAVCPGEGTGCGYFNQFEWCSESCAIFNAGACWGAKNESPFKDDLFLNARQLQAPSCRERNGQIFQAWLDRKLAAKS